jgi:hypothetical protein
MTDQMALFGPDGRDPEPATDEVQKLRLVITVKAAPNPSERYGETVCVAGVSADLERPGWIRLYPINFRHLEQDIRFRKYDIISVDAVRARSDVRHESWNPRMSTVQVERQLRPWDQRKGYVTPYIEPSMCAVNAAARASGVAPSLGLVRAGRVDDLEVETHPGWSAEEQAKIDRYVNQFDLFGLDRTALEAPRLRGWYRWHCQDARCGGHRQGILDWEFVAFQRNAAHRQLSDAELASKLRDKFLNQICASDKDVAFYVGNQAKRHNVYSVLGVWWPPR